MINVEIDGKQIQVPPGTSIIEAAEQVGVWIPRFCYHKKLSVAANCRMCLVEVEKAPKPLASCATPVAEGMRVHTLSKKSLDAQKIVMEFLLVNHPLDCPICDQGGECELQDVAMGYGEDVSRYSFGKRSVQDEDLGPLISTDMTRCIHCTRCVRFGEEIAGVRELGLTDRGESARIGTYVKQTMSYEMSGNIIDLCPVGALTSKPFRFAARPWELNQYPSIAAHDCVGSHINVHTRRGEAMRVVPRENEALNEVWLSDRDRFSYEGATHTSRLQQPMIKKDGQWHKVTWSEALSCVVEGLQKVIEKFGPAQLGGLLSPNSTVEEGYLLQRLLRELGCHNIDYRLRQTDFSDQAELEACPSLGLSLPELETQNAILLIGSAVQQDVPIVSHRIRQASLKSCDVMAINMLDYDLHFSLSHKIIVAPNDFVGHLAGIAKALVGDTILKDIHPTETQIQIAEVLKSAEKSAVIVGFAAQWHPQAAVIRSLSKIIADAAKASHGYLTEGANSAGLALAGCLPHRTVAAKPLAEGGVDVATMFDHPLRAYMLMNIAPAFDCSNPRGAVNALAQADFVVALSSFGSDILSDKQALFEVADVLLPMTPWLETSGTFVNALGDWQRFSGVAKSPGEARPAWKILRVLGQLSGLDNFDYASSEDIYNEVKLACDAMPNVRHIAAHQALSSIVANDPIRLLQKVTEVPWVRQDALLRHSRALQDMLTQKERSVRMNTRTAQQHRVAEGQEVKIYDQGEPIVLPVMLDETVPDAVIVLSAAMPDTSGLDEPFGFVEKIIG